jgi:pimeloyl-ACP methyl ester carboxylesterase
MPKALANGIQIHYQQMGEGPDLVLIHGVTGDLSSWYLQVMPALAKEYRVTAYDLRGHGHSEVTPSGYTSAHMAADLHGLLGALGIDHAHLVGYSFGGTVALHCAVLHPERVASLILGDPMIPALRSLVDLEHWPYLEAAKTNLKERDIYLPEEKWFDLEYAARQILHTQIFFGPRQGMKRNSRRLLRLLNNTSALKEVLEVAGLTLDRIPEVRQPVLAMYGEASPVLQIALHLRDNMPNCRLVILEGLGHFFALSNPELLVTSIREFHRELAEKERGE